MRKFYLTFILAVLLAVPALADATFNFCDGYGTRTGQYVYGQCRNGQVTAYNSQTGSYVYGNCQTTGFFTAYDSRTGEFITGYCR